MTDPDLNFADTRFNFFSFDTPILALKHIFRLFAQVAGLPFGNRPKSAVQLHDFQSKSRLASIECPIEIFFGTVRRFRLPEQWIHSMQSSLMQLLRSFPQKSGGPLDAGWLVCLFVCLFKFWSSNGLLDQAEIWLACCLLASLVAWLKKSGFKKSAFSKTAKNRIFGRQCPLWPPFSPGLRRISQIPRFILCAIS